MTSMIRFPFLYRQGSVQLPLNIPDPNNQVFHHKDEQGVYRHFHINTLMRLVRVHRCPLLTCEVTEEQGKFITANHGIEERRIATMPLSNLSEPGLLCKFPDGTDLIVEGNHRFVWLARHGMETMEFYEIPEEVWKQSLLRIPKALAEVFTGS